MGLKTLSNRMEINDLFARYVTALDVGDVETIVGCFEQDGALEYPVVGVYIVLAKIRRFAAGGRQEEGMGGDFRDWLLNMNDRSISWWTFVTTVFGVAAGLVALYFTWRQVRDTRIQSEKNAENNQANSILQIREAFDSHIEAHINLRPGGVWHNSESEPTTTADYAKIELYMGLFEFCDELLERELLDLDTFKRQYNYRIQNLLTNGFVIGSKLVSSRENWLGFINLCYRVDVRSVSSQVMPLSLVEQKALYPTHHRRHLALAQ